MTEEQKQAVRQRIGQRIKVLRTMAELSQEQLAERAGLQRTHVGRIEAGKYAVTLEVVQAIAEALGMTVDIIDPGLQNFVRVPEGAVIVRHQKGTMKGTLGDALENKVTDVFNP